MESINEKWTISLNYDYFNEYEYFDTKEEAIVFGNSYEEFDGRSFYVGKIREVNMMCDELAINVLEEIEQQHQNNDGEFADDYLHDVKREHIEELDNKIKDLIIDWATKHDYHPKYFRVNNVELISVEKEPI